MCVSGSFKAAVNDLSNVGDYLLCVCVVFVYTCLRFYFTSSNPQDTTSLWNERASLAAQLSFFQRNVSRLSDAVDSLPTERSVTIPSFDMFQGCTTIEDESISCTIPPVLPEATHEPFLTPPVPLLVEVGDCSFFTLWVGHSRFSLSPSGVLVQL